MRFLNVIAMDTGRSIAPERVAELFLLLNRLGAQFSDIEGTCIGLAIASGLVG